MRKVKSRYAISGYADWRIKVKNWGKKKPTTDKKKTNNKNNGGNSGEEVAYEAPGFGGPGGASGSSGFDICDIVDCSVFEGQNGNGGDAYEDPNAGWSPGSDDWNSGFTPSAPEGGGWEPVSDYKVMTGKTIYGRRINSILPCVGNIARRYTDCQSQCNRDGKCTGWTWASFDCSWVGDSTDSGICYLMTDTDAKDVFTAPKHGDFISGMKRGGSDTGGDWDTGGGGGWDSGSDGAYEDPGMGGSFDNAIFDSNGNCIGNCGPTRGSSGAYEAPGY